MSKKPLLIKIIGMMFVLKGIMIPLLVFFLISYTPQLVFYIAVQSVIFISVGMGLFRFRDWARISAVILIIYQSTRPIIGQIKDIQEFGTVSYFGKLNHMVGIICVVLILGVSAMVVYYLMSTKTKMFFKKKERKSGPEESLNEIN